MALKDANNINVSLTGKDVSLGRALDDAANKVSAFGRTSSRLLSAASLGFKAITLAATAAGAAVGLISKDALKTARDMTSLQKAMSALDAGGVEGSSMEAVRRTAKELGIDLKSAAEGFRTLAEAAQGTELAGKQTEQMFADVSRACKVLNVSANDTEAVFSGMAGMIRKGTVGLADFQNAFGKRIPNALDTAAKSMGMTRERFTQALKGGQIAVRDFLPQFSAELRKGLGEAADGAIVSLDAGMKRVANSVTNLRAAWGNLVENNAYVSAFRDVVAKGLDAVAESIETLSGHITENQSVWGEWVKTAGQATLSVAEAAVASANVLYGAFQGVKGAVQAVGAGFIEMYAGVRTSLAGLTEMASKLSFGETAQQLREEAAAHREKAAAIAETARRWAEASQESFKATWTGSENLSKLASEIYSLRDKMRQVSAGPIEDAMRDVANATRDGMGQARRYTEKDLEEMAKRYQEYARKVKGINEDIANRQRSLQDELRSMARGGMNAADAWVDQRKAAQEYMKAAKQAGYEAQRALAAGDMTTANAKYKEAIAYADQAKSAYKELNHEVKIGDEVVISAQTALKGAMNGVKEAGQLGINLLKEQEQAIAKNMSDLERKAGDFDLTGKMAEAEKQWLEGWRRMQGMGEEAVEAVSQRIVAQQKEIQVVEAAWASAARSTRGLWITLGEDLERKLNQATRPRTVTVYTNVVQGKRYGGMIEPFRFARGGRLPGFGGGDKVSALLERGEFVIRKEAVRRFGAGFFHALNALKLPPLPDFSGLLSATAAAGGAGGSGPGMVLELKLPGGDTVAATVSGPDAERLIRFNRRVSNLRYKK